MLFFFLFCFLLWLVLFVFLLFLLLFFLIFCPRGDMIITSLFDIYVAVGTASCILLLVFTDASLCLFIYLSCL